MATATFPASRFRSSEVRRLSLDRFPRHKLTFGPSPIERMDRLAAHLGGEVEIFAKREDCNSGLAFGGNKTRKLEYLIPEALAQGCDTLVSIGGVQSHHTRQVAAVAAKLGLKCRLVQESWVDWNDAVYDRVGNILLSRILGADVRLVDQGFDIGSGPPGRMPWRMCAGKAGRPMRSRPAPPITGSAASASSIGRRR